MSIEYEIRGYQPGDEKSILAGFNKVFREVCGESYVDRGMEFWDWEFGDCPFGHRITVGCTPDGEVAAHYGGVPYPVTTCFGPMRFVHIVDSFVLSEHRAGLKRPGLFVNTAYPWFDLCRAEGDAVMYGYPVKAAERIGKRYLEYNFLRVVNYLVRPVDTGDAEGPSGIGIETSKTVPQEVDALFATVANEKKCLTTRNHQFLDWRYVKIPGDDFEIVTARRDGALCGLIVLRPEHELIPGACSIADWVVPEGDTEACDALLAAATRRAREGGRQNVMAVFADTSLEFGRLCDHGFELVPSTVYMERRLTQRIYDENLSEEFLAEHWWYTLGDSDLV